MEGQVFGGASNQGRRHGSLKSIRGIAADQIQLRRAERAEYREPRSWYCSMSNRHNRFKTSGSHKKVRDSLFNGSPPAVTT